MNTSLARWKYQTKKSIALSIDLLEILERLNDIGRRLFHRMLECTPSRDSLRQPDTASELSLDNN